MSTKQRWFLILLYWLPIPGLPRLLRHWLWPAVGRRYIGAAEYVLVQSFGRDVISDKILTRYLSELLGRDRSDLGHCFGRLWFDEFKPGEANLSLAYVLYDLMDMNPDLLVVSQWEVLYGLWNHDPTWFRNQLHRIECLWPPDESYFATVHVKRASKQVIIDRGLSLHNGIELAHPDMAIRAKLILWRLGLDPAILLVSIPYAPRSVQLWVRHPLLWFPREAIGRVLHHKYRWISFTPPVH